MVSAPEWAAALDVPAVLSNTSTARLTNITADFPGGQPDAGAFTLPEPNALTLILLGAAMIRVTHVRAKIAKR